MRSITSLDVTGKRVLLRTDFNVPIQNGAIEDESKLVPGLLTINHILKHGGSVVIMSHLGRPQGRDPAYSLLPVAKYLNSALGKSVEFVQSFPSVSLLLRIARSIPGDVFLLENVRFNPGEEENDPTLAHEYALLGDVFVNDAFASSHREHASVVGPARFLPSYGGLLLNREVAMLEGVRLPAKRPFVIVLGGSKLSTKLSLLKNLVQRADAVLLGGAMVFTFYQALGQHCGASLVEPEFYGPALELLKTRKIMLPTDIVIDDAKKSVVRPGFIPINSKGCDIGPETCALYATVLEEARTVFWNGPVGIFEQEGFAKGTNAIASALAGKREGYVVAGGGDTLYAIAKSGLSNQIRNQSTGGGASLEYLEGKVLPGLKILEGT